MSEAVPLTSAQLAAGREKRRSRLFERHCDGTRLNAAERAEISDLISTAEKANQLELQSPPAAKISKRTGLIHPLAHYAELLDVGLRTVKRWLAEGVKARDACPLDDLASFGAWWKRLHPDRAIDSRLAVSIENVLTGKTSSRSASAASGAQVENRVSVTQGDSRGSAPAPSGSTPGQPPEPSKPLIAIDDVAAITLEQNRSRLATIHGANMELLERAFKAGSHVELDDRQRKAERSQRMLIDAQTALDEHLKQRGDLLPRDEVKRELLRVHTAMAQSLVGQLVQLGIVRERALMVVESWFGHLRQSRFAASTAPELRPAPAASAA